MTWDDKKFLAFDFETSGEKPEFALQPWRVRQGRAWATSLVWKDENQFYGGLSPDANDMAMMLRQAITENRTIVGWNVAFDIGWLLAYGLEDLVFQCRWLDGMLLWKHYYVAPEYETDRSKKKSYGLKSCVAEFLPEHAGYEEDIDFHATDRESLAKLHEYNQRDVDFTLQLTKHWYEQLKPSQLRAALIEAECLPMVAYANLKGMLVDTLVTNELAANLELTAAQKLELLAAEGVTEKIARSPIQLGRLLFDEWKLPVLKENTGKKTGKVSRATDKEVLHELAFKDERARTLREYREALNNRTKFAIAPLKAVSYNEDGCAHPQAIVFGTYSGRLTYSSKQGRNKEERQTGFALHQEKRGEEFRSILIPPPGYTLVEFDAAGQEFRWMAIASEDDVMLELCSPGGDPHSYMGAAISGIEYKDLVNLVSQGDKEAKSKRQLGKVANLSLQYRTSARKLRTVARVQYGLPMELPEAEVIHKTYQQAYVRVPRYWSRQIKLTRDLGYVETFAGRRVQVKGDWDGSQSWSMGSTSINYRIQGTGADQKYLAMAVLRPYLRKIGGYFAWDLHDGIYLYIPDHAVDTAIHTIKQKLDNLPYEKAWNFKPPIPLPWDVKSGPSWGALKEVKI